MNDAVAHEMARMQEHIEHILREDYFENFVLMKINNKRQILIFYFLSPVIKYPKYQ